MYHPGTITLTWENSEQIFKECPNHMRDQWYYGWWCLVSSSWTFLVETYPIKGIKLSFKPSEVSAKPKFLPNLFALKKHEIWDLNIKVSNVISMKIYAISHGYTGFWSTAPLSVTGHLRWVALAPCTLVDWPAPRRFFWGKVFHTHRINLPSIYRHLADLYGKC